MLEIISGHRQELLAELLAASVRTPLSHPLAEECIIVQSQGMGRWLQQQIAERSGIAANLDLSLPAQFMWRLYRLAEAELPDQDIWSKDVLTWRIYRELPACLEQEAFSVLAGYLRQDHPELRLYQLSQQIADVLDHYLIYRPDWCVDWCHPEFNPQTLGDQAWQALLWQRLSAQTESPHRAALHTRLLEQISTLPKLPERLSLFGIPYLPAGHLAIFRQLAERIPVTLYQLNPTPEYWGDVTSRRQIARISARSGPDVARLFEEGHPLLASWGRPLRDHVDSLLELPCDHTGVYPREETSADPTLLQRLQQDIFALQQPDWGDPQPDTSLQIHSCHSPLREVEVLYDQLQELFQTAPQDDPLDPRDVVVMTPDITTYAPFIEAVFGAQTGARHIPWTLSDLSHTQESALVRDFIAALDLIPGKLTAPDMMGLLESPLIAGRLGWDQEQLARIRRWLDEAAIRFGDEAQQAGSPSALFSWRAGLERLLLGYVLEEETDLYAGIAPYTAVSSTDAETLGSLLTVFDHWQRWRQAFLQPQTPTGWVTLFRDILDTLFGFDSLHLQRQDQAALDALLETLQSWQNELQLAAIGDPLPADVVRQEIGRRLDAPGRRQPFLNGAVTFCAMVPMRSLPFRVIAILGMNQELFPRQDRPLSFDLIARHPRRGDRIRRDEDRFLFLEALLSAREVFYLSYVGSSIKDNSERPPAVVVSELLDVMAVQGSPELAAQLVTRHRLQPFHPAYFSPPVADDSGTDRTESDRLFSYQAEWCPASTDSRPPTPFIQTSLAAPEPAWFSADAPLSLNTLLRFLGDPSRFFARQRLQIELERQEVLRDHEPFTLQQLDAYQVRDLWLQRLRAGDSPERIEQSLRARGLLPLGEPGEHWLRDVRELSSELAPYLRPWHPQQSRYLDFDLREAGVPLHGRLTYTADQDKLLLSAGRLKGKRWLQGWAEHLLLSALQPAESSGSCCLLGVERNKGKSTLEAWTLPPVARETALEILGAMTRLVADSGQRPLALFPQTGYVYAQKLQDDPEDRDKALRAARREWHKDDHSGEGDTDYCRIVWRQVPDPLETPEFHQLSESLWTPLLGIRKTREMDS